MTIQTQPRITWLGMACLTLTACGDPGGGDSETTSTSLSASATQNDSAEADTSGETASTDPDSDSVTDTDTTTESGDTVPSDSLGYDETWTCDVTPNDGESDGASVDASVYILAGLSWDNVSAGGYHTCGVTGSGSVECWGWDGLGQVSDTPLGAIATVSGGRNHTCGVTPSGTLHITLPPV